MSIIKTVYTPLIKLIISIWRRGRCPHCGDSMDSDDIVCQTCGYPDND